MNRDDVYYLGSIVKKHGYKGDLSIRLEVDFPEHYKKLESVFVEINNEQVPFFIQTLLLKKDGKAVVHFEGVDNSEAAEALVSKAMYLPVDQLPKLSEKQFYFHEIIGFEVRDYEFGKVGTVISVNDEVPQPLMFIEDGDSEIIVPIVDPIVQRIDRNEKTLHIEAPEGLIEFYRENG